MKPLRAYERESSDEATPVLGGDNGPVAGPVQIQDSEHPQSSDEARQAKFMLALNSKLRQLQAEQNQDRLLAGIAQVVAAIVRRETGAVTLEEGMGLLFHLVWGGGAELRTLSDLYYQCRQASSAGGSFDFTDALERLHHVVSWYGKRKQSLKVLEESEVGAWPNSRFFGTTVVPDRMQGGEPGFELHTGVRLVGFAYRTLWLRLFFRLGSRVLRSSRGYTTAAGGSRSVRSDQPLCITAPIVPDHQRQLIDDLTLFIPYRVLEVPPGDYEFEGSLSIVDENEVRVISERLPINLEVPAAEFLAPFHSTQLIGLWSEDYASGSRLEDLSASWVSDSAVRISFSLLLCGFEGRELAVTARILDESGYQISPYGLVETERAIVVDRSVSRFNALRLEVPLTVEVAEDEQIHIEVALTDPEDNRTLLGAIARLGV